MTPAGEAEARVRAIIAETEPDLLLSTLIDEQVIADLRVMVRADRSKRRRCRRGGHDLDEVGVYVRPSDGARICRACRRGDNARYAKRNPDAMKMARYQYEEKKNG